MPRGYSDTLKRKNAATSGDEVARTLLEITNPALPAPIRVVDDNQDLVSNGHNYVAFGFEFQLPDEVATQVPRATLALNNAGEELTSWIDASRGGRNSSVRVMQVLRSAPDTIEWETTLDLR